MSFSIVIQQTTSEKNRVDKTVADITTLTGVLKEGTSIINPVFLCVVDLSDVATANYCTVSAFNRKYFIVDMKSVDGKMVEIYCHVDVLSTYATEIRGNTAIIHKSENAWNLYLNDGSLQAYQFPKVYTKPFPTGFSDYEYILIVAGG